MKIFSALKNDAHQGWVWLQDKKLPRRSIVSITNPSNGMTIYCEALQIDSNFLKSYNQSPRIFIDDEKNAIVLGAWYRAGLGGIVTQADISLEINACNSWIGKFCACINHPQIVVRQSAWLSVIGLFLGVIGLGLGVAALW